MRVIVKKWGNSASVRIPSGIMEAAHICLNDAVDVRVEDGRIVIEPIRSSGYQLADLLDRITPRTSMTRSLLENLSAKRFCSVKRLCTGSRRYCLAKLRPEGRPRTSGPKASAGHQPICLQPEDGTIGLLPDDIPDQGVSV